MKLKHCVFIIIIFCLSVTFGGISYLLQSDVVDMYNIRSFQQGKPSVIVDANGEVMVRFELDRRTPITIDMIPHQVIQAFVAAEDHAFFSHGGLSYRGILRSVLINLYHRRVVQGASTITQQVARLLYLSYERTWWRKLKEVIIAFQLERRLTKGQILELYLNNVYFGQGIYGVEAACQRFWGKSVKDVTVDEAAMLAAIAKSARFYSPLNAPLTARKRRNVVLRSMFKQGFIDEQEFKEALEKPLTIEDPVSGNPIRLYLYEWIRMWAENKWGRDVLYTGGLTIKTTINQKIQHAAEVAFSEMVTDLRKTLGDTFNGGLVSLEVQTGKIRAAVGGLNFKQSQFNRAFKAYRQIGSSIKPYLYSLALADGYDMDYLMVDDQVEIQGKTIWRPRNWTNKFEGTMTLARALVMSNNSITIKLGLTLGIQRVLDWLQKFGLTHDLDPYPSSLLGTPHATTEENAAGFNVFANNGVYVKPLLIEWVKNDSGKKIWEYEPYTKRLIDAKINAKMVKTLMHRMTLAQRMHYDRGIIDCESIGKTGSTNGAATMWFVGSTPTLTTAIYLGRDDSKMLGKYVYASRTALPLWIDFQKQLTSEVKHFYIDPSLKEQTIDWWTGQLAWKASNRTITILKE